ncbi:MAG TPA: ATP-binding protein [Polyangiales bacterium]|nr:ATP-binding protein [Polyangiales bacterium]
MQIAADGCGITPQRFTADISHNPSGLGVWSCAREQKQMACRYPTAAYSRCPRTHVTNPAFDSEARRSPVRTEDWLIGGGEMGEVIRGMDWSRTALGPIEGWPQSLRTTVSLCLASNFPISIAWGPQHIQIYNDGYWPICGGKHPTSMGQNFAECWASAMPAIGDAFSRALLGETSFLENRRMFLDRHGYLEETFFTFSFSPIRDESGGVGGLFHPVTETTGRMLNERRTRALRDLAARCGRAKSSGEALTLAAQTLQEFELDLPFVLLYEIDERERNARLVANTGLAQGTSASPLSLELGSQSPLAPWPLAEVVHDDRAQCVEGLEARLGPLRCGPYPESPQAAWLLPLTLPGAQHPSAVLVAGVSSRLPLNESYRAFYELLAASITASLASARAYEIERQRAEALAEIDRAKTEFFSNVSHEFRTPLTLILGPLEQELAERDASLPEERRERLSAAHRNGLRLLKLVNTLLDFSRLEAGRVDAHFQETDLAQYTAELGSVFRSAIERAGLTLEVDCPVLPERVFVDRDMWEKIVLNLVSNAFKHTFSGTITVRLRPLERAVELTVADSGVGIPVHELPRVFDRFHRVRGAKARTHEGTGIGLSLVRELVGLHHGSVELQSQLGHGSVFSVRLPTGHQHLPADRIEAGQPLPAASSGAAAFVQEALHWALDAPPDDVEVVPSPPPDASRDVAGAPLVHGDGRERPLVLWVDDNSDMRDYVRRLLADRYEVLQAADGATALRLARNAAPDLILSDVMMPGLDGFGLVQALRADRTTRTIPLILLSARAGEGAAIEGLEAGADDYLAKPFTARELLARVRTHLELSRARKQWGEELERANRELEAFSYSVSHDLRAPLRAIDGFSKALLSSHAAQLDEQGKNYLDRVRAATQRMGGLIDDLLNLSRISRGELRREDVDITRLARGIAEDMRRRYATPHVTLEIEPGLHAAADPSLLSVVLENLLANAWKFSSKQEAPRVTVGKQSSGGQTVFFVRDNGAGFDMAYSDNLFRPFQRLHSQSEFEGTGIGLATVQRVINRHSGRIWAEGAVGAGATFFFTLERSR